MSGLTGFERLEVVGQFNGNARTPSGESFSTTTGAIAALGGGAASGVVTPIDSGVNYTTNPDDTFLRWRTATAGAKNTYVTTGAMVDGQVLIIKDYGAGDYPQTVQPFEPGVTIEYQSSYVFDPANGASINLKWEADESNLIVW